VAESDSREFWYLVTFTCTIKQSANKNIIKTYIGVFLWHREQQNGSRRATCKYAYIKTRKKNYL
jgi:hypothetical protein